MNIITRKGLLDSNTYLVEFKDKYFFVDASYNFFKFKEEIPFVSLMDEDNTVVLITHAHIDHIFEIESYSANAIPFDIVIHKGEEDKLMDSYKNCSSAILNKNMSFPFAMVAAKPFENIEPIEGLSMFHTPGHSEGSCCYMFDDGNNKALFTGDTLFKYSIGRTDLPGGDYAQMNESISLLKSIYDQYGDMDVYPGHGPATTLMMEIKHNPYFR